MPSVSVDPVPQTSQPSSRARNGRDSAPASNDQFGMLVENDTPAAAPTSRITSATEGKDTAQPPHQATATSDASQPTSDAGISSQDDTVLSESQPADDTIVPIAVFVGLQATTPAPAGTVIESSATVAVTNPPVTMPGETAALALARVAQDTKIQNTQAQDSQAQDSQAQDSQAQDSQAQGPQAQGPHDQATVKNGAPARTPPQAPAEQTATGQTDAAAGKQPAQDTAKIPAIVAPVPADANAELQTATDLTARIPAEAVAAEADAKIQTAIAATPATATEHGRLIASAPVQPVQPLLAPLKPSTPPDTQTLKPPSDQNAAEPISPDAPKADPRPATTRHAGQQDENSGEKTPLAPVSADKPNATQSVAADTGTRLDIPLNAVSAPVHTSAVPQLTAAPANPNIAVPVTALAVEIAANVQIGRSRFEIRLDPPELGRIEVKLDVDRQGQVTSHIIVEKAATLDLLRRDAPQLERALQDAGLKTSNDGLQFSLRDQQSQSGRQDDEQARGMQRLMITEDETVPRETAGRSYGRMLSASGGIDMRV